MNKAKYLSIIFLAVMVLFLIPSLSNAAVEYTRTFPSNDGTIKINLAGLELDVTKAYEFGLFRQGGTPVKWFNLDDGYTESTATVTLSSATSEITNILKATDTAFISIREVKANEEDPTVYALQNYQVNLKLPYLQSLQYREEGAVYSLLNVLYGSIGNLYNSSGDNRTYVNAIKVKDENLIKEFLNLKNNDQSITKLEAYLPAVPDNGFEAARTWRHAEKNDGLYLVWVLRTGENCKEVYSCIVHDGLPEATTVEEYTGKKVAAPVVTKVAARANVNYTSTSSGKEYQVKQGNEVSVIITFDQPIVLNESPTLAIKFGTGSNINLTTSVVETDKLVFKYIVKAEDEGAVQVLSLTGGNVTNATETEADLTLVKQTGDPVVAIKTKVEEPKEDEKEPEEDKKEEKPSNTVVNNTTVNNTTNNVVTNNVVKNNVIKNNVVDNTTSAGKIPNTGKAGIAIVTIIVAGLIAFGVIKYKQYKEV